MHFITSALVVLASATSLVSAHGRLQDPKAVDTGFHTLKGGNLCGVGNFAAKPPTASFAAGSTQTMQWFILNGDGAGKRNCLLDSVERNTSGHVEAFIDPTGTGSNLQPLTIVKNVGGNNGRVDGSVKAGTAQSFTVKIPDVACGANGCLMQVKQAAPGPGFGSCAKVSITGGKGGAAAAAGGAKGAAAAGGAKGAAAGAAKQQAAPAKQQQAKGGNKNNNKQQAKGGKQQQQQKGKKQGNKKGGKKGGKNKRR
ncbi:hypothetical protein HDU97_003787 [Phlyctochytrium planicorne]|nr:hypothetical protein HDU97_003787 [Phlyctochytrium planicorne]